MTTSSVSQLFRKHIGHHTDIKSQLEKIADKKSNQLTCAEKLAVFDDLTMKLGLLRAVVKCVFALQK